MSPFSCFTLALAIGGCALGLGNLIWGGLGRKRRLKVRVVLAYPFARLMAVSAWAMLHIRYGEGQYKEASRILAAALRACGKVMDAKGLE